MSSCFLDRSSNISLYHQQDEEGTLKDPFEEIKGMLLIPSSPPIISSPALITTAVSVESPTSVLFTPPITPTTKHASSIASSPHSSTPPSPIISISSPPSSIAPSLPSSSNPPSPIISKSPSFIPILTPPPPPLPTTSTTTTTTTTITTTSTPDLSLSTLIPIAANNLNNVEGSPSKEPAYYTLSTGIQKAICDRKLGKSRARNLTLEWYRLAKLLPITKTGRIRVIAMAGWFEHRDKTKTVNLEQLEKIVEDLRREIFKLKEEEFMDLLFEKRKSGTKYQV